MEVLPQSDAAGKRKRSPSSTPISAPPAKVSKPVSSPLSINYLARQSQEDLPLLNKDDTIPSLLQLLSAYSNVLDRHESLASNLGARPLGPILIRRFERCFDAPPKVVASHHKGSTGAPEDSSHHISWLEVIEFARAHPGQFTLSTFSEGRRVCQFYYPQKQLRVQISEEDFLFINSGRCQELIPPLPIWEDEEKEVGTCDVLEAKLKELTNAADMVAARTRQLSHRLKGRRAAILERRAEGGSGTPAKASALQTTTAPPSASGAGFMPVNNAALSKINGEPEAAAATSSAAVRTELLRHFESLPHNQTPTTMPAPSRHHSVAIPHPESAYQTLRPAEPRPSVVATTGGGAPSSNSSLSPVPPEVLSADPLSYYMADTAPMDRTTPANHGGTAQTPYGNSQNNPMGSSSKHNFSRPLPPALESSQPFRPLCQAHMDGLIRGQRVLPPCDRCRRLHMDCVKNLTSCAGCTKKHARCHWRDVSRDEVGALDHLMEAAYPDAAPTDLAPVFGGAYAGGFSSYTNGQGGDLHGDAADYEEAEESEDEDSNPLEDLEALGEKEEREVEERRKEDEEGLMHARELARQGLAGHDGRDDKPEATTATSENKSREPAMAQVPSNPCVAPAPEQMQHPPPPTHGGFHAVNEHLVNGSDAKQRM